MDWYYYFLAAIGLSVDTLILSMAFGLQQISKRSTLAVVFAFTFVAVLALVVGWSLSTVVPQQVAGVVKNVGTLVLLLVGVTMFWSGVVERSVTPDRLRRSYVLILAPLASSVDAGLFGCVLQLGQKPLMPMIVSLAFAGPVAAIAGLALGRYAGQAWNHQAEAYGGILLISLAGCGIL